MPIETTTAIEWALTQTYTDAISDVYPVTKENSSALVDCVRAYFNQHEIEYSTFSYDDLKPYLL